MSVAPLLICAQDLERRFDDPHLRLIDTRYYLDGRDPLVQYAAGHLPRAVYLDMERDLTGHPGVGGGRHPLPTAIEFEQTARAAGIAMNTHVVVYSNSFSAARVWWLLRYFGFERVSLLDGGLQGWPGPLERGVPDPPPAGDFMATARHDEWLADFAEVTARGDELCLLDARGPDRFRGEVAPGDPYPGHVPGALSAHWEAISLADGHFADPATLRARLTRLGVGAASDPEDTICYCGSGVQACQLIFAAALAGLDAPRLYVGSWSEYSRRIPQPA